jgi:hypothetical protein
MWNDSARQDFENEFWTEFVSTTTGSIEKLQHLVDTVAQAERQVP